MYLVVPGVFNKTINVYPGEGWARDIAKSYLASDKYCSEITIKIDTVKDQGVRSRGMEDVPEPLETPSYLRPWL